MGLQSALTTALTGMSAAETSIDVAGNNVANANTVGFKSSNVNFATQFLQTQTIGSAPTSGRGGTNPRQVGLGVKVAEIAQDFKPGTVELSSNPLDLAIQGDGFFIVQGSQGEELYTRNGQFKTNAQNEIVTTSGQRVLGYGVDDDFNIQSTTLRPLQIPLGQSAVAQATQNVVLTGGLNAEGTVGSVPEIIQSGILSDGSKEAPDASASSLTALTLPLESTTVAASGTPGSVTPGTYSYRVTFVDNDGNESPASKVTANLAVPGAGGSIDLNNIPQPAGGSEFSTIRIYRNNSSVDTDYRLAGSVPAGTTAFNDGQADGALGATLDDTSLNSGAYSYYVTYYNSVSGEESRPSARFGPVTADATNSPKIRLDDIPAPSADPTTGGYDGVRIYRNLTNNSSEFHLVDSLSPAQIAAMSSGISYIDNAPDSAIASNAQIDLEGPDISFGLPLVDVVSRNGANYVNLFEKGELAFTGSKNDASLATRKLTITDTTTVQDLISFMEDSMGIVKTAQEDSFPAGNYGGTIEDSRIQFTSNLGKENALSIDLSAFQLTPEAGGVADSVPLQFNSLTSGETNGTGDSADVVVYDSLGSPLNVRISTVLEERDGNSATFRWIATSPDNQPELGVGTVVGTGVIVTNGNGDVTSVSNDRVAIDRRDSPSASPLEFKLDFSQVNGLSQDHDKLSVGLQDGFAAGTLSSFTITESGNIQGVYSNGSSRTLGQLVMSRFANNNGLEQKGDNLFAAGVNSGLPIRDVPNSQGLGSITAGAVELSNTDIGQNLIELITASTQYRGGARVITAVQQLLDELMSLRR